MPFDPMSNWCLGCGRETMGDLCPLCKLFKELPPTDTNLGYYDDQGFYHPSPEEEALFRNDMENLHIFDPEGTDHIEIEFTDDDIPF